MYMIANQYQELSFQLVPGSMADETTYHGCAYQQQNRYIPRYVCLHNFRAPGGLPGASVVAVGAVLLLPLFLVSGSGPMLLLWLHLGLFNVMCVVLFLPHQCAFGVACRGWLLGALYLACMCCRGQRIPVGAA